MEAGSPDSDDTRVEPHHFRRILTAAAAILAAAAPATAPAAAGESSSAAAGPTLNGSFERGLDGWRSDRGTLSLVRGVRSSSAALVALRGSDRSARSFSIYRWPRPVTRTSAGAAYRSSAWVRAPRGHEVCLRVREIRRGTIQGGAKRCSAASGRWQQLAAAHTARRDGSQLGVAVIKRVARRKNSFRVDAVSIAALPAKSCSKKKNCPTPPPPAPPPAPQPPPAPPPPAPPAAPPPPPSGTGTVRPGVGAQFHCAWGFYTNAARTAVLDKLAAAGVTWVRIDAAWAGMEDSYKGARNAWYIGMIDFCVNEAQKRGMNVLVTLWMTPAWANGGQNVYTPPTNPVDYGDFARWAAGYWKGRVAAWEVWNEPDPDQSFWQGTVTQYAQLLKAAYPGFKAGDPNAPVVFGGPSLTDDGWIRQVYAAGAAGSFDVMSTHPYQGMADAPPETADDGSRYWLSHTPAVRRLMAEYGDGDKPIWFTEFGWSEHANWSGVQNWQRGVTPQQQGDYMVRAIEYTRKNLPYVPVMFWYKERSMPGGTSPHHEGFGLLNADLSERPVYWALKSYLTGS